jgi:chitodextrinase
VPIIGLESSPQLGGSPIISLTALPALRRAALTLVVALSLTLALESSRAAFAHGTSGTLPLRLAAPRRLAARAGNSEVSLTWAASKSAHIAGYRVYRNGTRIARKRTTGFVDVRVRNGVRYTYYVIAYDRAGVASAKSKKVTAVPRPATVPGPAATVPGPAATVPGPAAKSAPRSIYWGAWIGSQLTGAQAPWDLSAIDRFQELAGKPISVLNFSSAFYDCSRTPCQPEPFPTPPFNNLRARGIIPFFSWASASWRVSIDEPNFRLSAVAAGGYDAYIRSWAKSAAAWGHPFFLRFNWEMNGNWFPWGASANGNSPADYVAAWRHVHDIFTSVGATNVTWVWCPNVDPSNSLTPLASLYPGDAYVDWTCLDGYNGDDPWASFSDLFSSTYAEITGAIAPSKPMIVGETASTEAGGSKAQWISTMLSELPSEFPKIRGLLWFDKLDSGPGGHTDWPIESSSDSVAAFAAGINNSLFTTNSFSALNTSPIPPPS